MRVKELIKELQKIEDKELDVVIATDYDLTGVDIEGVITTDRMIESMNCVRLIPESI